MDFLITPPGYVVDVCKLEMVGMGLVSSESKACAVSHGKCCEWPWASGRYK